MGRSYSNITVKGQSQDALFIYLKKESINAYVSPTVDNFTVIYEQESNYNLEQLSNLAIDISQNFNCVTFAIGIYDESTFCYELYKNGELLDKYISSPEINDDDFKTESFPEGGDAEILSAVLSTKKLSNKVRPILREPKTDKTYLFASIRHRQLIQTLGLPMWLGDAVGGYQDIEEEEIEIVTSSGESAISLLKRTFD